MAAGAYKLRLHFLGMCLFVSDKAEKAIHVLLPETCEHQNGHTGDDEHFARMYYDAGHVQGYGPTPYLEETDLKGHLLDFGQKGAGLPDVKHEWIADLTPIAGTVPRSKLEVNPVGIVSRITLGQGALADLGTPARWDLGGQEVCMTNRVVWDVGTSQGTLNLRLLHLADGSVKEERVLHPVDARIDLFFLHVLANELPPQFPLPPTVGTDYPAVHFPLFSRAFKPGAKVPTPLLKGSIGTCGRFAVAGQPDARPDEDVGPSAYTCMVAGADAEDESSGP